MTQTEGDYEGLSDAEVEAIQMLYGMHTGDICINAFRQWLERSDQNKRAFKRIGDALTSVQSDPSLLDEAMLAFLPPDSTKH